MPDQERRTEDLHIPLHVEEVPVSRREIKKADVQIALITGAVDRRGADPVPAEIQRVPIDRTVEIVPPICLNRHRAFVS